jgi:putative endopeptidase
MRRSTNLSLIVLPLALAIAGCTKPAPQTGPTKTGPTKAKPKAAKAPAMPAIKKSLADVGLDATALDRSVDPCKDFYRFACGGWIKRTKIPGDKPRWVRSFSEIHQRNEADLKSMLEVAAKSPGEADKVRAKLGAFFRACMDTKKVERAKLRPLSPLLRQIRKVKTAEDLRDVVLELHRQKVWVFFSIDGDQDFADATRNIAHLDQAGLGLPDRDYYLKKDAKSVKLRAAYQQHVARMLRLSGYSKARAKRAAKEVMAIETALAKVSKTRVQRRDPRKMYNKIDRKGVLKAVPRFGWKRYLAGLGLGKVRDISVTAPKFFAGLNRLLGAKKPREFGSYLTWHVLHAYAPRVSKSFVDEAFALKKVLTGQKEQRPRWKRCVASTDAALGELLAQPFIAKRFAGDSKKVVTQMVHAIGKVFGKLLVELPWLDKQTRAKARQKLDKMAFLIGYPERWRRYPFAVGTSYAANVQAARAHELRRRLARIGKAVDPKEWEMSPPTVNAYYHPLKNHMVFPAGILQPPFYTPGAAIAVNMGAMGMVVGHELTHGFDDQGSRFDAFGNLKNWWGKAVRGAFEKRTQCMIDQYAGYEPLPGVKLNGKLTLGENIADAGGVKLAYRAYKALRAGKPPIEAEGLSEDQLFFVSNAQIWCAKARESFVRLRAKTDPHSPPRFRVNGALQNAPEFSQAFGCKAATPMAPAKRCEVW